MLGKLQMFAAGVLLAVSASAQQHPLSNAPGSATTLPTGATYLNEDIAQLYTGVTQYNLLYYTGSTFTPARWSEPLNFETGNVTITSGSTTVTCTNYCNFSTPSDVGSTIVLIGHNSTNVFQTTIQSVTNGNSIQLTAAPGFTDTAGFAYMGTDLTSAINTAEAFSAANNACIYVPSVGAEGQGYFYNGTGQGSTFTHPCFKGDGPGKSLIFLGASSRFLDDNAYWQNAYIGDIGFYGGLQVVRNRYAAADDSNGPFVVERVNFEFQQNAAVEFDSTDMPYQIFRDDTFYAQQTSQSIGIASNSAGPDYVYHNAFLKDFIDVKLGAPGGWKIFENDFINFYCDPTNVRAALWLLPQSASNGIPDLGLDAHDNKFGNENLAKQDVRLLFADQAAATAGQYFGDLLPTTTIDTANSIGGFQFHHNTINGGSTCGNASAPTAGNPIMYSETRNVRQLQVDHIMLGGTYPTFAIEFDPNVVPTSGQSFNSSVWGPFLQYGTGANTPMQVSSLPGYGITVDPNNDLAYADPSVVPTWQPGQGPTGRVMLMNVPSSSWSTVGSGSGSVAAITGPDGITPATQWTFGSAGAVNNFGRGVSNTTGIVYGVNTWMEYDVQQGASNPASAINVTLSDSNSANSMCAKFVYPSSAWVHYIQRCVPQVAPTATPPRVAIFSVAGAAVGQTVNIANFRIYQSQQPDGGAVFDNPVRSPYVISTAEIGSKFTATGCANSALIGGSAAGQYTSGTIGTCTVTLALPPAPNAWACSASDVTTPADNQEMTASTANSATIAGTTVSGDVVVFFCMAY